MLKISGCQVLEEYMWTNQDSFLCVKVGRYSRYSEGYSLSLPRWIPWGRYIVGGGRACGSCQSGCLEFLGPSDYLLLSWLGFYAVGSWGRGTPLVLEKGPPEYLLFINEAKAFYRPLPPFSSFNKPKDGLGFFFFLIPPTWSL